MSTKLVTEEQASPEESPTRYMLPEQVQEEESGLISYKYGNLSPAKYPFDPSEKKKKKKRKSQTKESKKKKPKTGKTVHFHSKVIIKTKSDLTEIELSHEEEYAKRHSDFTIKRAHQKQWMKLHHQQRPMTPKQMKIQATIQRENGNA